MKNDMTVHIVNMNQNIINFTNLFHLLFFHLLNIANLFYLYFKPDPQVTWHPPQSQNLSLDR